MLIIIYLAPFILLAAIAGLAFFAIPRLRRYAIQAAMAPIAFSVSAITGMLGIVLIAEHFGAQMDPVAGVRGVSIFLLIFVVPGMVGAWIAVVIAGRIQRRATRFLGVDSY